MANKIDLKNLGVRTLSGLLLASMALGAIYKGGMLFNCFILAAAILMAFEWIIMTEAKSCWKSLGFFYILAPCVSLIYIRDQAGGAEISAWFFITIWIADIAAFFSGKIIGGPKLAPYISPNKTWAGLIGALTGALIFSAFLGKYFVLPGKFIFLSVIVAFLGQSGDLLESWIKRKFKIKDSGSCIPGHGGILDRLDSITLAAPALFLFLKFYPL